MAGALFSHTLANQQINILTVSPTASSSAASTEKSACIGSNKVPFCDNHVDKGLSQLDQCISARNSAYLLWRETQALCSNGLTINSITIELLKICVIPVPLNYKAKLYKLSNEI